MNHVRELAVIEVISRCIKLLIRDGLTVLAETDPNDTSAPNAFTDQNIKRTILHYLLEIFKLEDNI